MRYPESVEREMIYHSAGKLPYNNEPLVRPFAADVVRKIGGSHGVTKYVGSGETKPKKPMTKWQALIKKTMTDKKLSMKDAIKHIKDNNLY